MRMAPSITLCKLKQGIHYHDDPCFPGGKGREVVAADEQYTFQRICDPKVECPVSANLSDYVAGMTEAMDAAKKNGDVFDYGKMKVSGVEVIDPHTFKLHLLKPYPQIRYWMAMFFTAPVAREGVGVLRRQAHPDGPHGETVNRPSFKFHPVGDGRLESRNTSRGNATDWSATRTIIPRCSLPVDGRLSARRRTARLRAMRSRWWTRSSSRFFAICSPCGCSLGRLSRQHGGDAGCIQFTGLGEQGTHAGIRRARHEAGEDPGGEHLLFHFQHAGPPQSAATKSSGRRSPARTIRAGKSSCCMAAWRP